MPCGVLPWIYPVCNSLGFLDLGDYLLLHFKEVFIYYLLKYFLMADLQLASSPLVFAQSLMHMVISVMKLKDDYSFEGKLRPT